MLICICSAFAAIIAAIVTVIILVKLITNPADVVINSNSTSLFSTSSSNELLSSSDSQSTNVAQNTDAPKINGIKDGATYYTTQFVYITDKDLKTVTVNGNAENKSFLLDGNLTYTYVIEATDAEQNVTVYTVYTKPISSLFEPISHLNENTVTLDYYEIIKDIKTKASKIDTKYSSTDESSEINSVIDICNKYLDKIDYVTNQIDKLADLIKQYEETQDFANINNVANEIDTLLSTENLTHEQRLTLKNMSSKCYSWMHNTPQDELIPENIE